MFKSCGLKPSARSEVVHELSACYAGGGAKARRRRICLSSELKYFIITEKTKIWKISEKSTCILKKHHVY